MRKIIPLYEQWEFDRKSRMLSALLLNNEKALTWLIETSDPEELTEIMVNNPNILEKYVKLDLENSDDREDSELEYIGLMIEKGLDVNAIKGTLLKPFYDILEEWKLPTDRNRKMVRKLVSSGIDLDKFIKDTISDVNSFHNYLDEKEKYVTLLSFISSCKLSDEKLEQILEEMTFKSKKDDFPDKLPELSRYYQRIESYCEDSDDEDKILDIF